MSVSGRKPLPRVCQSSSCLNSESGMCKVAVHSPEVVATGISRNVFALDLSDRKGWDGNDSWTSHVRMSPGPALVFSTILTGSCLTRN